MKYLMIICLLAAPTFLSASENDENANQLNVEILKNKATEDCPYMESVVLEVKFQILEEGISRGNILLKGSVDGVSFHTIKNKPFVGVRGASKFRFDAGECLKAISVNFSELN